MKHAIRTTLALVVLASMATMAAAQTRTLRNQKPTQKPLAVNTTASALGPMVGTWTLRDESNKPLNHIRMVFRPNGTFAFVGPGWQSTGKYSVQDHRLSLEWATVDGEKIAPGKMKKEFAMAEDDSSFTIDKYTYYKRS